MFKECRMAELVESYGVFAFLISSTFFKFQSILMPHAFCLFRYHSLNKTSAQSLNKGIMQKLKVIKAFCNLLCQAQKKYPLDMHSNHSVFLSFFPLYHPMLRSYCICEEAMCFKSMSEMDVQIYSMNICMLLPRILFILFCHFIRNEGGLSLEK